MNNKIKILIQQSIIFIICFSIANYFTFSNLHGYGPRDMNIIFSRTLFIFFILGGGFYLLSKMNKIKYLFDNKIMNISATIISILIILILWFKVLQSPHLDYEKPTVTELEIIRCTNEDFKGAFEKGLFVELKKVCSENEVEVGIFPKIEGKVCCLDKNNNVRVE